ncbi:PH domain-containing protein [Intrasporangium sp.]|uniref:PH domain-containing protein n=1 Tax=Intrasporangium sp. TaxID=1925024 RepID=UPI003221C01E
MQPQDDTHEPLREPANLVSRRAVSMWTVEALVVLAVLLAGQVVWWWFDRDDPVWHWVVAALWLVLGGGYALVMPRWRYRVHRWEATPEAIYTQRGWLNQERRIAPVSRVQTVDLHRGPIAQAFGLASVTVTTASAAGPLRIEGLDVQEARWLVEVLTAAAVAETGDAT